MPQPDSALTAQQRAWFKSLREGLERDTGRTLEAWVEIARTCSEAKPRARLAWFKAEHGLGQNRASLVLDAAFPRPADGAMLETLENALWADAAARSVFAAVKAAVTALPEVIVGQRKGYTAFSRRYQFAAARPVGSAVLLGLAADPAEHPLLAAPGCVGWSERLKAEVRLADAGEVAALTEVVRLAWARS